MTKSSGSVRLALLLSIAGAVAATDGCVTYRARVTDDDPSPVENVPDPGFGPDASTDPGFFVDASTLIPFPGSDAGCPPQAPVPDFGTPVTCDATPPPISGGTLLVSRDGSRAIASDPDRDAIYVVDLASMTRKFTIVLQPGDEPGRLAEDGAGRIHVALRGSGALLTIDPSKGTVTSRRVACPAPRGVAWQAANDTVWVACATGELASLPAAGGAATLKVVGRDLRDVIVNGDSIAVTLFRSAQLLRLAADGTISRTDAMLAPDGTFASHVAWRAVPGPGATVVAVHQAESTQSVSTTSSGGYGCNGILGGALPSPPAFFEDAGSVSVPDDSGVASFDDGGGATFEAGLVSLPPFPFPPGFGSGPVTSVLSVLAADGSSSVTQQFNGVLPVDVAISPDGSTIAAVAAGSGAGAASVGNLYLFGPGMGTSGLLTIAGQTTALAFKPNGDLLVQTREPAALWVVGGVGSGQGSLVSIDRGAPSIPLSLLSRRETGHDIFHTHAGALIACASCHPEGGDDGHVWLLDGNERRTPSLRGTIEGTAPYHWPGDEHDFAAIVHDVYEVRMSGGALTTPQTAALSAWVNAIPAPPAPTWVDANAAAAGRVIFQRADTGCSTCHSGPKFTNNQTVNVGTGGAFQVPPLVGVGWRTPLLHNGCAATIADRFGACGTAEHGNIQSLTPTDMTNLTAYLETL